MYKQLSFDNVIECSLFTKQHILSQEKDYLFPYFIHDSLFEVRELRNLMFNNAIAIFGEYKDDELTDLVYLTLVRNNKYAFCILDLCPMNNVDLIEFSISTVFAENPDIKKCKFTASRKLAEKGHKLLTSVGLNLEVCLRKFQRSDNDVLVFGRIIQQQSS